MDDKTTNGPWRIRSGDFLHHVAERHKPNRHLTMPIMPKEKKNQTVLKAPIVPQSTWKQRFSHRKDLHLCNLVPCLNLPLINLMTSSIIQSKIHQLILCRQQQHELYRAPNVWLQHTTLVALLWVADSAYKNNIIRSPACNTFSNTLVTVNFCGGFAGPYTVAQDQHTRDGL